MAPNVAVALAWNVEKVHPDGDMSVVVFMGTDAEQLASEYLDWKNVRGRAKLFELSPARCLED